MEFNVDTLLLHDMATPKVMYGMRDSLKFQERIILLTIYFNSYIAYIIYVVYFILFYC